jgi:hypothetical protein
MGFSFGVSRRVQATNDCNEDIMTVAIAPSPGPITGGRYSDIEQTRLGELVSSLVAWTSEIPDSITMEPRGSLIWMRASGHGVFDVATCEDRLGSYHGGAICDVLVYVLSTGHLCIEVVSVATSPYTGDAFQSSSSRRGTQKCTDRLAIKAESRWFETPRDHVAKATQRYSGEFVWPSASAMATMPGGLVFGRRTRMPLSGDRGSDGPHRQPQCTSSICLDREDQVILEGILAIVGTMIPDLASQTYRVETLPPAREGDLPATFRFVTAAGRNTTLFHLRQFPAVFPARIESVTISSATIHSQCLHTSPPSPLAVVAARIDTTVRDSPGELAVEWRSAKLLASHVWRVASSSITDTRARPRNLPEVSGPWPMNRPLAVKVPWVEAIRRNRRHARNSPTRGRVSHITSSTPRSRGTVVPVLEHNHTTHKQDQNQDQHSRHYEQLCSTVTTKEGEEGEEVEKKHVGEKDVEVLEELDHEDTRDNTQFGTEEQWDSLFPAIHHTNILSATTVSHRPAVVTTQNMGIQKAPQTTKQHPTGHRHRHRHHHHHHSHRSDHTSLKRRRVRKRPRRSSSPLYHSNLSRTPTRERSGKRSRRRSRDLPKASSRSGSRRR